MLHLIIEIRTTLTHAHTLMNSTWKFKIAILHAKHQGWCNLSLLCYLFVCVCWFVRSWYSRLRFLVFTVLGAAAVVIAITFWSNNETMAKNWNISFVLVKSDGFASCFMHFRCMNIWNVLHSDLEPICHFHLHFHFCTPLTLFWMTLSRRQYITFVPEIR